MRAAHHHPPPAQALHERLRRFLRGLANGKLFTPEYRRGEARVLLQAIEEGSSSAQDGGSPHYVEPRPLWQPDIAFEGHDKPRPGGNVEPEESALKASHPEE
jgi:hypothetical protein